MKHKGIEITWQEPGSHTVRDSLHPKGSYEFYSPGVGILYWFDTIQEAKEYIDYLDEVGIL